MWVMWTPIPAWTLVFVFIGDSPSSSRLTLLCRYAVGLAEIDGVDSETCLDVGLGLHVFFLLSVLRLDCLDDANARFGGISSAMLAEAVLGSPCGRNATRRSVPLSTPDRGGSAEAVGRSPQKSGDSLLVEEIFDILS